MTGNKRNREICDRLEAIAAELRELSVETEKTINVIVGLNKDKKTTSTVYSSGYRFDHYYDGSERISYENYMVNPEEVVFGDYPIGLKTTILLKQAKREKK